MKTDKIISGLKSMNKPELHNLLRKLIDRANKMDTQRKQELINSVAFMSKKEALDTLITIIKEVSE